MYLVVALEKPRKQKKKKNDNNNEVIKQKCNISKMMVQHNTMMNSKCHCLSGC